MLPSRVGEPDGLSTGADHHHRPGPGPPRPPRNEPLRHTVERGETAFTIARLYSVTPRALAEWNGLPADMSVREGQILMIPVTPSPQTATPPISARR